MKNVTQIVSLLVAILVLGALAMATTSMTIAPTEVAEEEVVLSEFDEIFCEYEDLLACEEMPAYFCGNWSHHQKINCGCAPNSTGNSSSTYTFHKNKYKRTCWVSGYSWVEYSPWVCNQVCL